MGRPFEPSPERRPPPAPPLGLVVRRNAGCVTLLVVAAFLLILGLVFLPIGLFEDPGPGEEPLGVGTGISLLVTAAALVGLACWWAARFRVRWERSVPHLAVVLHAANIDLVNRRLLREDQVRQSGGRIRYSYEFGGRSHHVTMGVARLGPSVPRVVPILVDPTGPHRSILPQLYR